MNIEQLEHICKNLGAKTERQAITAPYTTFKIGGPCDLLVKVNSEQTLAESIVFCRKNKIPYTILGNGSNVLISDKGVRGVVFVLKEEFRSVKVEGNTIICDAGASLFDICRKALEHSLTGLEFAYGIPGTAGGALFMNAGAYGGEMKDVVSSCRYLDLDGNPVEIENKDMDLSYRHSIFCVKHYCITQVTFTLEKGDKDQIKERMETLMQRRKTMQPLEYPSAGSTFKRPANDYAARLIEQCGLKGLTCGGAQVSTKHSGFVINHNHATSDDILELIQKIQERVYSETGITLECEMRVIS